MTRHIFAGSEAEEQRSPGRAGPRRLRPPASAPSSCPATSGPLKPRGPAGAPESQLRKLGTRLQRPLRPTHANVASRPPPSCPRRPHPLLSLLPLGSSRPSRVLARSPSPPGRGASAAALVCGRCSLDSGRRREKPAAAVPARSAAPSHPYPCPGTTAGLQGSGQHLLGRQSGRRQLQIHHDELGICSGAPRRRPCPSCRGAARTRLRRRWRWLLRTPRHSLLRNTARVASRAVAPLRLPPPEGGARARALPSRAGDAGPASENPPPLLQLTQEARWPRAGVPVGGGAACPEEGCISPQLPELTSPPTPQIKPTLSAREIKSCLPKVARVRAL